jgi:excisionase family DNA binding protein
MAKLPNWPARMGEDMAADYLGISRPTLREGAKAGRLPAPLREGGRILWAKKQLDDFVAAQFEDAAGKNSWD